MMAGVMRIVHRIKLGLHMYVNRVPLIGMTLRQHSRKTVVHVFQTMLSAWRIGHAKRVVKVAFLIGAAIPAAQASSAPDGQSPVRYQVPASWKLLKDARGLGNARTVTYEVTEGVAPSDHATVMIKTYEAPSDRHANSVDTAEVAKRVIPSGVPISDAYDGPDWRTCVFLGRIQDAKIVALYRVGIQNRHAVEEIFIFPLPTAGSQELGLLTVYGQADQQGRKTGVYAPLQSTYKTISVFNEFTKTLGIGGPAPFHAKAVMAKPATIPSAVYRWDSFPSNSRSIGG